MARANVYANISITLAVVCILTGIHWKSDAEDIESDEFDGRVTGGVPLEAYTWPWLIEIRVLNYPKYTHRCGATLVAESFVLTVERCVRGISLSKLNVIAAEHILEKNEGPEQARDIAGITYIASVAAGSPGTLALLELKQKFDLNDKVRIAKWKRDNFDVQGPIRIAGWGYTGPGQDTKEPFEVEMPIVSNEECSKQHGKVIRADQLCSGEEGKSICNGDPGDPIVEGEILVGLAESSENCKGVPANIHSRFNSFERELEKFLCGKTGMYCHNYNCQDEAQVRFGISSRIMGIICQQMGEYICSGIIQPPIRGPSNVSFTCPHYTWMEGEFGCYQKECPYRERG